MTQYERMVSGLIYNPADEEVMREQVVFQDMLWEFNRLKPSEYEKKEKYMKEVFAECGDNCYIEIADWLCADDTQLDAYLFDSLCRKTISAGLFWQLLGSMKRTGSKDAYHGWNKDTPILLMSGQEDPVGDSGKGVLSVKQRMEKAGIRNVAMQLLPNARHDLLHEESTAAPSARDSLLDWITHLL